MRRVLLGLMVLVIGVIVLFGGGELTGRSVQEVNSPMFSGVMVGVTLLMFAVLVLRVVKA